MTRHRHMNRKVAGMSHKRRLWANPAAKPLTACGRAAALGMLWLALGVALATVGTGCAAGAHARTAESAGTDAAQLHPPAAMEHLVGALMRYRAAHGRLPGELDALVEAGMLSAEAGDALAGCAYAPAGLAMLPDGRRLLLVDAYVRQGEHAWCVVDRPTAAADTAAQMELVLVPMDALRRAAEQH